MASVWTPYRLKSSFCAWLTMFLLLTVWALALGDERASAQEYVFRPYRQSQGLGNLSVNSLAADRQGFLWVATENGVYRFLGSGFQRFGSGMGGIGEQEIEQVFSAPDGTLWVGGEANLYRWGGQNFQAASPKPIVLMNDTSIAWEGPGRLLVLSHANLYRFRYKADGGVLGYERVFSPQLIGAHPSLAQLGGISALPDGTVWMACGRMLCSWRSGKLTEWASRQGVAPDLYRSFLQDHQGALWAVGQRHVVELPRASDGLRRVFIDRSLPAAGEGGIYQRLPIACDPLGRIIVSLSGGIARWNGAGWQTIGKRNGLNSTHVTAFQFDENGSLWLGSSGTGLHHWIGYGDWQGWTDRQGLPSSNIWSIGPFEGDRVLLGTERGPASVDSGSGAVTLPTRSWTYGQVTGMIAAPNEPASERYLVSTASGALVRMEGRPARASLVGDLHRYIYGLRRDALGRTLAIAGEEVFDVSALLKAKTSKETTNLSSLARTIAPLPEPKALLGRRIWMLGGCLSPDRAVWLVSENGILRSAREANQDHWSHPLVEGLRSPLPRLDGLACGQDGGLWAIVGDSAIWHLVYEPSRKAADGTARGADRLVATQLVLPKALQTISAVQLFVDSRGWLWICTDDGLLVWNGSAWRQLTQEDGLIWNDVNAGNMASGPDGSIWVGTSGGVSRILHPEQLFATRAPLVSIVSARLGSEPLPVGGGVDLAWSRQDLSFQFAAANSLDRANLVFYYRIVGLHSDWIESREETAHFQALSPGTYGFEVFAQDRASGARSEEAEFRFRVKPPWWRTLWFYALCGLSFALGILALFRLRTRHLVGQQRRLESMVRERTAQLEISREELRHQASHDGLTGLLNRVAILNALERELARASRGATSLTLVLADIDHFKAINDTYGHPAGDEALRRFAAALADNVRPYDQVGRYGGEEFLLVLVGVDSSEMEDRLVALHRSISGLQINHAEVSFVIHCSLGVAQLECGHRPIDQKLALVAADDALYQAKRAGRNCFVVARLDGTNQDGGG